MHDVQDVFISYGRADSKNFAIKLQQQLQNQGFKVWFDANDIPLGVDYQNQIDDGIEKADNFLFIISPHSVNSPYCLKEIELAISRNKRITPLLQVEQISRETWQARNPGKNEEDWQTYQKNGLHSAYPNMHPAIAKINWIYCRETIDNFEDSLTSLVQIFNRQRDYVKKHTYFLNRALKWEREHKQAHHLLANQEYQDATDWLKLRFKDEQPPCLPTDLHCEYITESLKNANNRMTQVFLCHAKEEQWLVDRVQLTLMRECWTIWSHQSDVQPGILLQEAIDQGIESADNVIYLLSPNSLRSSSCQREIEYAIALNKRIIPVLMPESQASQLPIALQGCQIIDLTQHMVETEYIKDKNQLIRTLTQDAGYFEQHKILLAKAMRWHRQSQNPSLLLRGYNLKYAEAWLKIANTKPPYLPTTIQRDFIEASQQQPPDRSIDVFIAYSRKDVDFARQINYSLQNQGKITWFDQESIASGTDFQQEIFQGIESANHFLFIISPSSVTSIACRQELEYAQKLNKRIITILHQSISEQSLPLGLAEIQWIDFKAQNNSPDRDFLTHFGELVRTLDSDREQVQIHTCLLLRAMDWDQENSDPSFLLRGRELSDAEQWLKHAATQQPGPTDLQRRYITTSRRAPLRKPTILTVGLSSVGSALLVLLLRLLGGLQSLELMTYDQWMRSKPSEARDPRLLLVEIDDQDIQTQNKAYPIGVRGGSLPDPALEKLLDKLRSANPKVIGLDLYRDFATDQPKLSQHFQQTSNLVVLCKLRYHSTEGVSAPPELPANQTTQRVGFSDLLFDDDTVVRRQVLLDTPTPPECKTDSSFSLMIARQYLESQGKPFRSPFDSEGKLTQPFEWGKTSIPRLYPYSAAYFSTSTGGGYQTLINFRSYQGKPDQFIDRVKLRDLLADQIPVEKIRDRIVIIGVTSRASVNDYSATSVGELPGVIIQAQLVSQVTSAVLDGRSLIWWLPFWGAGIWILGWAIVGGAIVWVIQRPRTVLIGETMAIGILLVAGYGIFMGNGGWLPMLPAAMAIVISGSITVIVTSMHKKTSAPASIRMSSIRHSRQRLFPSTTL